MKASTGDWDEGEPETGEPVFELGRPFRPGAGRKRQVYDRHGGCGEGTGGRGSRGAGLPYADAGGRGQSMKRC